MIRRPPRSTLFPYTRSSDLVHFGIGKAEKVELLEIRWPSGLVETLKDIKPNQVIVVKEGQGIVRTIDRKSTRLNSSHGYISYAVFCLKKKKCRHTNS